jgi:DNA-binding XRE family transcriptional regulator
VVNEFEEVLDIKKERNKAGMSIGGKGGRDEIEGSPNSEKVDLDSDSWDEAAEEFNIGKNALSQGTKVKQIAEEGEYEHRGEPVEVDEEVQEVAEERDEKIEKLYLRAWNSQANVADEVGCSQQTVSNVTKNEKICDFGKPDDFEPNVYDIWKYSGSDNRVGWPGEIPQDIVLWIPVTLSHGD